MFVLKTDRACTDTDLPILKRDTLLEGDDGGVKWLFDTAARYSYPTQGAPSNGTALVNMDESGNDGSVVVQSGDAVAYAGGGLDFTGTAKLGTQVTGPAAFASSVWNGGSGNQYFLVCLYVKLPILADWQSAGELHDMLKWAATTYAAGAELVLIAQQNTSSRLNFRRQTGAGTVDELTIVPAAGDYGSFAQIAYWRDATGRYARLKTANGTLSASGAVGSNNTQNFSALQPQIGPAVGFKGATAGAALSAAALEACKYRFYRAFGENLAVSGRSASTVLDADYTRTVARGVFS